jgi:hypothetical protein
MTLLNIGEHISGGYLIVKPPPRPKDFSELLPRTLITVSSCFADIAPDLCAVDWDNYTTEDVAEEAGKFGIPAHLGAELVRWTSAEMKTTGQHPNAFLTLEMAREFWQRFVNNNEVLLIGMGLCIHRCCPLFKAKLKRTRIGAMDCWSESSERRR